MDKDIKIQFLVRRPVAIPLASIRDIINEHENIAVTMSYDLSAARCEIVWHKILDRLDVLFKNLQ